MTTDYTQPAAPLVSYTSGGGVTTDYTQPTEPPSIKMPDPYVDFSEQSVEKKEREMNHDPPPPY